MTVAKVWNGSAWITPSGWSIPRVWNGSSWVGTQPLINSGPNEATKSLTVGTYTSSGTKFVSSYTIYGYASERSMGSISNTTLPYSWGIPTITGLVWEDNNSLYLMTQSVDSPPNQGWSSVTINGVTFTRESATFDNTGLLVFPPITPGNANWYWSSVGNPFPAVGNTTTVTWNL